ncbi:MAG: hypothetical protein MI861_22855 [Pirellulales bacterium]|nr:hypothetical protein [Pirellulales bacterium]
MKKRTSRGAVLTLWLAWAWVTMTVSHEAGHLIGGWLSGGKLISFDLKPWHLPHSFFSPDPHPLITLWSGPLLGCLAPLLLAILCRRLMLWFVAWFCVLANASYLLLGYFAGDRELDTAKLLSAGTKPWVIFVITGPTLVVSYLKFRACCVELMSSSQVPISPRNFCYSAAALIIVLIVQAFSG